MMLDAMTDAARTPPDAVVVSLSDAAVRLGISPDATRKRLERGTLRGEKRAGRWLFSLAPDAAASTVQDAIADTERAARTPQDAGSDIAPLAELIGRLTRENQELAAAAAMWQERARFLGEQLRALEPGPIVDVVDDVPQEHDSAPVRDVARARAPESPLDRLRRLIGR